MHLPGSDAPVPMNHNHHCQGGMSGQYSSTIRWQPNGMPVQATGTNFEGPTQQFMMNAAANVTTPAPQTNTALFDYPSSCPMSLVPIYSPREVIMMIEAVAFDSRQKDELIAIIRRGMKLEEQRQQLNDVIMGICRTSKQRSSSNRDGEQESTSYHSSPTDSIHNSTQHSNSSGSSIINTTIKSEDNHQQNNTSSLSLTTASSNQRGYSPETMQGISYDKSQSRYRTSYKQNGKLVQKVFSIRAHGESGALQMALECRNRWIREGKVTPKGCLTTLKSLRCHSTTPLPPVQTNAERHGILIPQLTENSGRLDLAPKMEAPPTPVEYSLHHYGVRNDLLPRDMNMAQDHTTNQTVKHIAPSIEQPYITNHDVAVPVSAHMFAPQYNTYPLYGMQRSGN